ncbi:MAG: PIN domain-containing protein [Nitrospirae bacterium]|nr:PIN domain-containing protein [Candidatus Troglogloeales bacterium]
MKLVIDSNILISAYSVPGEAREAWQAGLAPHRLLISPEIFLEVERGLRQTQFDLSPAEITVMLKDILKRCEVVRPKTPYQGEMADENDRHLVSLAREVGADALITGNRARKNLETAAGIPILSLAQFLTSLQG